LPDWDDEIGVLVANGGDINNDGHDDIMTSSGADVLIYSGSGGRLEYYQFYYEGGVRAIAGVGDVNGDDYDDYAIGNGLGVVTVYSGYNGLALPGHTFTGDNEDDDFGRSIASAGDLDGDLIPDILVGAPGEDCGTTGGIDPYVRAFSGVDGSSIFTIYGNSQTECFGKSIAKTDDVSGDTRPDVIIGAPNYNSLGRVYVYASPPADPPACYQGNGFVQNEEISNTPPPYAYWGYIAAGYNVTDTKPVGYATVKPTGNVTMKSPVYVKLDTGFSVENGGVLTVRVDSFVCQ